MTVLTLKDGIVQDKFIDGVPMETMICPYITGHNRPKIPMHDIRGTTIHGTGNPSPGANAIMHARYVASVERNKSGWQASYHFCVDDTRCVQILPTNEVSWHAGDGYNGFGNRHTISIEICVNRDGNLRKAEDNAAKLCAALLNTYNIDAIYKHQDHTGKYCPAEILKRNGWYEYVQLIKKYKNGHTTSDKQDTYNDRLFRVQLGAFVNYSNAKKLLNELEDKQYNGFIVKNNGMYKVQTGAFRIYANAKRMANELRELGFASFVSGPKSEKPTKTDYLVVVTANTLNVRSGSSTTYHVVTQVHAGDVFTIVETKGKWGKLKSGRGWICLDYTRRI